MSLPKRVNELNKIALQNMSESAVYAAANCDGRSRKQIFV
jgi:hypothetical protein